MGTLCNTCGRLSQDPEFCDFCNADLGSAGKSLPPERCPLAADGALLTPQERHLLLFPEASILVPGPEQTYRVHWISEYDWRARGPVIEKRQTLQIAPLPTGRFIDDAQGRWLAFETQPDNQPPVWPTQRLANPLAELQQWSSHVQALAHTLEALHEQGLVWLNFNPNELTPMENGVWQIRNLDLEVFPFHTMPERARIHPHYAAPEIVKFHGADIGPRTDVFHLALFAYYWLAGRLPDGLAGAGLESHDFALPSLRIFVPHCPEGIIPVLQRGLSIAPLERQATPLELARALAEAVEHINSRRAFAGALRWEVGGETRTGKSKTELGRGNEDAILVKQDSQSAVALVADGVSTCDVGSGGLASMMTTIIIENALADGCTHEDFPSVVASAAQRGSIGLLEWAFAHGGRADLEAGKDLMGTTLTVGWLQGRELSVANLGDSRAYLITDRFIEQLTVDGDLASDLLGHDAAPEEVRELGMMCRALRECVGGCVKTEDGEIGILPESCTPRIARWPLVPGDVLIFCTDGLVEEGYFLEPQTVAALVREYPDRSPAELAHLLVEAADELQRVPTIMEPDGFGDNISCVVVKITEAPV